MLEVPLFPGVPPPDRDQGGRGHGQTRVADAARGRGQEGGVEHPEHRDFGMGPGQGQKGITGRGVRDTGAANAQNQKTLEGTRGETGENHRQERL